MNFEGLGDATEIRIGDLVIDLDKRCIIDSQGEKHVPPRAFDLLLFFVMEPRRLHSREKILSIVWKGAVVEDGSLAQAVWTLRNSLGESRRESLKNVARQGYSFIPWDEIRVFGSEATKSKETGSADVGISSLGGRAIGAGDGATGGEASVTSSTTNAKSLRSVGTLFTVLVAATLVLATGLVFLLHWKSVPITTNPRSLAIVVIDSNDGETYEPDAAILLRDRMVYLFESTADLMVLTEAELDQARADEVETYILISSGSTSVESGGMYLRADVKSSGDWHERSRLEEISTAEGLDELVHAVAEKLLDHIRPGSNLLEGSSSQIGEAVRTYHNGLSLLMKEDWQSAIQSFEVARRMNPESALIRFRLAQAYENVGELALARENFSSSRALAVAWDRHSPNFLEAERALATTAPDLSRVGALYLELYEYSPSRLDFLLEAARLETSAQKRLSMLKQVQWATAPDSLREEFSVLECSTLLALGRLQESAECAETIVAQISSEKKSKKIILAQALHTLGSAQAGLGMQNESINHFEFAASTFNEIGLKFEAVRIRAEQEALSGASDLSSMPNVQIALGHSAKNQIRTIEIALYRSLALGAHNSGRTEQKLHYLEQAETAAAAYGGEAEWHQLGLQILVESWNMGRVSEVRRRLEKMEAAALSPDMDAIVTARRADLLISIGDFQGARDLLLGKIEEIKRERQEISPIATALLEFGVASVATTLGDLELAERAAAAGGAVAPEYIKDFAQTFQARFAIFDKDYERARRYVEMVEERGTASANPYDMLLSAELMIGIGELKDAEAILQAALGQIRAEGYQLHAATASLLLAETAAARRDWNRVAILLSEVEALEVGSLYVFRVRIDLIRLVASIAQGQEEISRELGTSLQSYSNKSCDMLTRSALSLLSGHVVLDAQERSTCLNESIGYSTEAAWIAAAMLERQATLDPFPPASAARTDER